MSQLTPGTGSGTFAPFSGQQGVPLSSASPFPMAHMVPGGELAAASYDDGTYSDLDFVVPTKKGPELRTVLLVGVLVVVGVLAGLKFTVFKSTSSSSSGASGATMTVPATTIPQLFRSASLYSDPHSEFSAKFPTTPTSSDTQTTVVLSMASTTFSSTTTVGGTPYTYRVIEVPIPVNMTAQGGAMAGGKLTVESVIDGQEPPGTTGSLQSSTLGTTGPDNAWLAGSFVIQSSQSQYLVGKVVVVGTVAFVVEVQGSSPQPPGFDYFESSFQPGQAALSTLQPASTAGAPASGNTAAAG